MLDKSPQPGERVMRIGLIGLGQMGSGMAKSLLKAGHDVTVWNRSPGKAKEIRDSGAEVASDPGGAAQGEAVITMLADDGAVEAVVFGDGVLACLPRQAIHISMSTISAQLSARLAEAHGQHGQEYVSAPVFGRPEAAAAAKLFVVAAGKPAAIDRCRPAFDAMGQRTFVVSEDPVAANLIKLSGNFLIATVIEALGETIALMRKAGIDPERYLEVMTNTLFAAPVYKTYGGLIAGEKYKPAGFKAPLGLKDVRLVLAAGEQNRVPMAIASLVRDRLIALIAQEGEDIDWSAIAKMAARDAGL
jgi:3-hydroxyisobutyrate dehydrogenase-like beta-hydroxyacid dehydrogenase